MAPDAILFDLDGTIWDSFPWYAHLLAQATDMSSAYYEDQLRSGTNIIKLMHTHRVTRHRLRTEIEKNSMSLHIYDGVIETLIEIQERQIPMAAVTNLASWLAVSMASGTELDKHFSTVISPSSKIRPKPNPTGILVALERLGHDPKPTVWFVGDRSEDARAAAAANVSFIWASYGYQAEEPIPTAFAIDNISELFELCEQ